MAPARKRPCARPGVRCTGDRLVHRQRQWHDRPPEPRVREVSEYHPPSGGDPHTIVIDSHGALWFTEQRGQRVVRLEAASGDFTGYPTSGNPYGLAFYAQGRCWYMGSHNGRLGMVE